MGLGVAIIQVVIPVYVQPINIIVNPLAELN